MKSRKPMWQVVLWVALVAISSAAAKTAVATVFGQQHDWSDTEAGSVIIFMQAGLGALIIWPSMRHFTSLLVAAFAGGGEVKEGAVAGVAPNEDGTFGRVP